MSPETVANNLIQSLAMPERAKLCGLLEGWRGEPGAVIYEPGDEVQYAYFPIGASMASFRIILLDAASSARAGCRPMRGRWCSSARNSRASAFPILKD